jgi:hypothetical protein
MWPPHQVEAGFFVFMVERFTKTAAPDTASAVLKLIKTGRICQGAMDSRTGQPHFTSLSIVLSARCSEK